MTQTIEEICKSKNLPIGIRNNGGGYYNHCLFWEILNYLRMRKANEHIV